MLDNGTKKRIDSARDILVGKVPDPKSQVEQITIALIYKFMDDMDNQTEELGGKATFFAGEFKQYAWSRLLDRKFSGHERLLLYAEGIEKMNMNENVPQLFRDIFKGAFLPYRDPETLNLFLKEINGFVYDHSERLGDAFEYLLSVLSSQGDAGQFRTPRHIIDFIVEIVNPTKKDTVLDPACGTAGFLISSYKHILSQNTKTRPGDLLTTDDKGQLMTNFCGYDISPDMVRLSLVNMYLHSFANPLIYEYDTLTSEDRWDERYDVIMANPPFMSPKGGIRPHSRFTIKAKRSEVLFVDYIAEHLNVHGRAGVIVPEGIIFQSQNAYKNLRKMLVEDGYLYAVISLPAGIFNPYAGVKTSILLMDKTLAKKIDKILFVKIANDGFDLGAQRRPIEKNDLPQALKIAKAWKQAIAEGNGFELNGDDRAIAHIVSKNKIAESNDYNLSGDRYREVVSYANVKWPMVELGKVCEEIRNGKNVKQIDEKGKYRVTRIQTISNWNMDLTKTKWTNDEIDGKDFLRDGDILLSHINSMEHLAKSAIFIGISEKVVHGINLIKIRPDKKSIHPNYLHSIFLSSPFIEQARNLAQRAVNQASIKVSDIKCVLIPLPPLEVQEKIVAELDGYQKIIDGAKQIVENYKPAIKIDPAWPMVELGEVCEVISGQSPQGRFYNENETGLPFYQGKADFGKIFIEVPKKWTAQVTKEAYKNDILMSVRAPVGPVNLATQTICIGRGLAAIRPKYSLNHLFLFYILKNQQDIIRRGSGGSTFESINHKQIKSLRIPLPPLETQEKIVAEIESESELVEANRKLVGIFEKKIKDKIGEVWGE